MAKVLWIIELTKVLSEIAGTKIFVVKITVKSIVLKLWLMSDPLMSQSKKLESKSFPRPFSMPTQKWHDNTIGCDSRFRSNLTLADANPPGSWVNNMPFRHTSRQPGVPAAARPAGGIPPHRCQKRNQLTARLEHP